MGGISSERKISLMSGELVLKNIDKNKFIPIPIIINKKEDIFLTCKDIDFAFLVLHGKFGEDGAVQAILESLEIPYSGSGPLASGLAMDKDMTKKILSYCNVRTAEWILVKNIEEINFEKINKIGFPLFVKPNSGGSSIATNIVHDELELISAINEALNVDNEVIIEEYINGNEISIPIIDGYIYPTVAIKPPNKFFDLQAKYELGMSSEFIIELEYSLKKEVDCMLNKIWKEFKLDGYARIDLLVRDNIPFVLEINTLPGMGPTGLLPQSYIYNGNTYSDLITKLIEVSINISR